MHISDGILSSPVLISGAALAAAGTCVGLWKTEPDEVPRVGLLSAAFFMASLIPLPLGVTNVHLVCGGLIGLILRWKAVPAILVGLFLQAIFFQHGGLTTLGVNTVTMAAPAVLVGIMFCRAIKKGGRLMNVASFAAGALAIMGGALLVAAALLLSGQEYAVPAGAQLVAHMFMMMIEGVMCAVCVGFLRKVKPEMLGMEPI